MGQAPSTPAPQPTTTQIQQPSNQNSNNNNDIEKQLKELEQKTQQLANSSTVFK